MEKNWNSKPLLWGDGVPTPAEDTALPSAPPPSPSPRTPPPIALLSPSSSFAVPSFTSASESALCFPSCTFQERKTARKCKTNHVNAARNLINEAWENVSHNTCLHKSSRRGLTNARCCWRTEQRRHTHVIPLGLGRHCLFDGCQQSAHLVWQTALWRYREWTRRRRRSVLPPYEGKDGKSI